MDKDPNQIIAGFVSVERGMDSGRSPSLLQPNQLGYIENGTVRGGFGNNRPGYRQIFINSSTAASLFNESKFQGAQYYDSGDENGSLIVQSGGNLFRFLFSAKNKLSVSDITIPGDPNPDIIPQVFMTQAEQYMVIQDAQNRSIIYDGATSRRAADDEVPIGTGPMAYGQGRLWIAQGRNFIAGDIVGGPTGVLKFTENTYLNSGGSFTVPLQTGPITAMRFVATPNTALGQGELLIFTASSVTSVNLPTSRDEWKNLSDPIQTIAMINNGAESQRSTILVNGDVFMRSKDGVRSLIQAVRNFTQPGNLPISREMRRVLRHDTLALLKYGSAVLFDNRMLMTTLSQPLPNSFFHKGLLVMDFDLISGLNDRQPPAWDGLWSGLDIYQLVVGEFEHVERCFAFCRSKTDGYISNVFVTNPGTGYTSAPAVSFSSGSATATSNLKLLSATINAGGAGYVVGDVLTLTGGASSVTSTATVTTVSAGAVTAVVVRKPGVYTVLPSNPISTTGGTGAGCKLNGVWGVNAVVITDNGSLYTTVPVVSIAGGLGAAAVAATNMRNEIWEITTDLRFDMPVDAGGIWTEERITTTIETPSWQFTVGGSNGGNIKRLDRADMWVDNVIGNVNFTIKFKPDQNPCWLDWFQWQICASYKDCGPSINCNPKTLQPQFRPNMRIQAPPGFCNPQTLTPYNAGYEFSARIQWTGPCEIHLFRMHCYKIQDEVHAPCVTSETCKEVECTC